MIDGIYRTRFTCNGQDYGGGIVVIDGSSVHGGDPDYFCKGHYWLQDHGRLEATMRIQNYTGRLNALVGPLSSFELTLSGIADSQTMRLSGAVRGQAHRTIQIIMTKLCDLVDPSMGCFDAACAVVAATVSEGPGMVMRDSLPPTGMIKRAEVKRAPRKPRDR